MILRISKLGKLISTELYELIDSTSDGCTVTIGELKGAQIQLVVTKDESEFIPINPDFKCVEE